MFHKNYFKQTPDRSIGATQMASWISRHNKTIHDMAATPERAILMKVLEAQTLSYSQEIQAADNLTDLKVSLSANMETLLSIGFLVSSLVKTTVWDPNLLSVALVCSWLRKSSMKSGLGTIMDHLWIRFRMIQVEFRWDPTGHPYNDAWAKFPSLFKKSNTLWAKEASRVAFSSLESGIGIRYQRKDGPRSQH